MRAEEFPIGDCPDEERLAALLEHRLGEPDLAEVETHVSRCGTCLEVVASMLPSAVASGASAPAGRAARPSGVVPKETAAPSRRWALAAALVFVAGGLLFASLQRPLGARLAPVLAKWGSGILGSKFDAKGLAIRMGKDPATFVVTLRDVAIGHDPKMFVSTNEIGVTVALSTLFSGEPLIAAVRVSGPQVNLAGMDLSKLLASRAERQRILGLFAKASRIDVVDGRVLLPGPGGTALAVERLNGGLERTDDGARIVLQGESAGGTVDVTGAIAESDHELTLTIGGRDLDAKQLPIIGEHITGAVNVRLDLRTRDRLLRADGRLAVRSGTLIGHGPGALVHLGPESREALHGLDPALTAGDLRFDDARAIFTWHAGAWRLPRVFLTARNVMAGGRGRITPEGVVTGQGSLRLAAPIVDALQPHEPALAAFLDPNGGATLRFAVAGSLQSPQLTLGQP